MPRRQTRTLGGLLFLLLPLLLAVPLQAELVIDEILSAPVTDWNGDGEIDYKNDEWVEIRNTGDIAESLDGVFLRDGTGEEYHYGFTGQLMPGEVRLVLGSQSVAWQLEQGLSTVGLSLNNTGDRVELWRDVAEPRVLDALDAIDVPAHAAAADRAFGRDPVQGLWSLFDGLNPYTGTLEPLGTGCPPSPGVANDCPGNVPVGGVSWGALKALW